MKKLAYLFILSITVLFNNALISQETNNWLESDNPIAYAKLYLHTDRDIYFKGDSIWFKAYYVDGQSQQLIDGFHNLFAELIDSKGAVIHREVLPMTYGVSSGNIKILQDSEPGNYTIRAYTDFQRDFGEEAFFHKTISVSKVKSSLELEADEAINQKNKSPKIAVSFLPEGGMILENQMNIIGVKAIDETGKGISVKGSILNKDGVEVSLFGTEYRGMGKFHFIPLAGESYSVRIDDHPDFEYRFQDIKKTGIKLEFIGKLKNEFLFRVTTNSDLSQNKPYYFAFMHNGEVISYQKIQVDKNNTAIKIHQDDVRGGINRIVLLDEQLKPISERLFFSNNLNVNKLKVKSDQNQYNTRSAIALEINELDSTNTFSNLSVSVVDENAILAKGPSTNILSYLLIDSELKGHIETPANFFIDEEDLSSSYKLDLLMLTQGWSNYIWNELKTNKVEKNYGETAGITVSGSIKRIWTKKPVINGDVVLGLFKGDNVKTYSGKTDENGRFSIGNVFFTDTASMFLQARNSKGKRDARVFFDPIFKESPKVTKPFFPSVKKERELSLELFKQQYFSAMAMKAYDPAAGSIMLDEIVVSAQKIEKNKQLNKIYGSAWNSWSVHETDYTYRNVFRYLEGRVAGVEIWGSNVTIRGRGTFRGNPQPLFLLNGMEVSVDALLDLPMSVIDEVDVLKSTSETAIFGMRGANGVIAIYTKRGEAMNFVDPFVRGAIKEKIMGYAPYREFYSPKYTTENINSKRPDNRLTLYWNPYVLTQNGKAKLSFFTSDDISNFKVFVEGITNDGRICLGEAEFSVNEYNSNLIK